MESVLPVLDLLCLEQLQQHLSQEQRHRVREGWAGELSVLEEQKRREFAELRSCLDACVKGTDKWAAGGLARRQETNASSAPSSPSSTSSTSTSPSHSPVPSTKAIDTASSVSADDLQQFGKAVEMAWLQWSDTVRRWGGADARHGQWLETHSLQFADDYVQANAKQQSKDDAAEPTPSPDAVRELLLGLLAAIEVIVHVAHTFHAHGQHAEAHKGLAAISRLMSTQAQGPGTSSSATSLCCQWALQLHMKDGRSMILHDLPTPSARTKAQELALVAFQGHVLMAECACHLTSEIQETAVLDLIGALPLAAVAIYGEPYPGRPTAAQMEGSFVLACINLASQLRQVEKGHHLLLVQPGLLTVACAASSRIPGAHFLTARLLREVASSSLQLGQWNDSIVPVVSQALALEEPSSDGYAESLQVLLRSLLCKEASLTEADLLQAVPLCIECARIPVAIRTEVLAATMVKTRGSERMLPCLAQCGTKLLREACASHQEELVVVTLVRVLADIVVASSGGGAICALKSLCGDGSLVGYRGCLPLLGVVACHTGRFAEAAQLLGGSAEATQQEFGVQLLRLVCSLHSGGDADAAARSRLSEALRGLESQSPLGRLQECIVQMGEEVAKVEMCPLSIRCFDALLEKLSTRFAGILQESSMQPSLEHLLSKSWQLACKAVVHSTLLHDGISLLRKIHHLLAMMPETGNTCERLAQCALRLVQAEKEAGWLGQEDVLVGAAVMVAQAMRKLLLRGSSGSGVEEQKLLRALAIVRMRLLLLSPGHSLMCEAFLADLKEIALYISTEELEIFLGSFLWACPPGEHRLKVLQSFNASAACKELFVATNAAQAVETWTREHAGKLRRNGHDAEAQDWERAVAMKSH